MWEQLTPADIERVKHHLALERGAMLSRHVAELKELDAQQDQIDEFERLVAAFAAKYINAELSGAEATPALDKQPTEEAIVVEGASELQDQPAPVLHVEQRVSPNFGIPLRRFVGR